MAASRSLSSTFRWAAGLALVYTSAAFLWSVLGFASPTTPTHLHEYTFPALLIEVGGHVLFGAVAAAPSLDPGLVLLGAGEGFLVDADHLLSALNYPVEGRLAHSMVFALVAAVTLSYLAQRWGEPRRGVFFVTLSAVAAHLSYDVFAGYGLFPILAPMWFAEYDFPQWTWPILIGVALIFGLLTRKEIVFSGRRKTPAPQMKVVQQSRGARSTSAAHPTFVARS